jgi:hypothetical protein
MKITFDEHETAANVIIVYNSVRDAAARLSERRV